jgi:RNA polymerase sigma-70 factor (ECF subfamily)
VSVDRQEELLALMRRVAAGDRGAFADLYGRTGGKLFASVRRILRSEAAAEDAVQEAYVRIWRRAGDFDPAIASPIAWMTTIARHAAIDMLRRGPERISAAPSTWTRNCSIGLPIPLPTARGSRPEASCRSASADSMRTAGA